jgi:hypothetical protein
VVWLFDPTSSRKFAWATPLDIIVSETGPYKLGQPLPGMEIFAGRSIIPHPPSKHPRDGH